MNSYLLLLLLLCGGYDTPFYRRRSFSVYHPAVIFQNFVLKHLELRSLYTFGYQTNWFLITYYALRSLIEKKSHFEDGPSNSRPDAENRISIHGSEEAGEPFEWCGILTSQHQGNLYGNLVRGITRDRID
jgi:hypothetical protein